MNRNFHVINKLWYSNIVVLFHHKVINIYFVPSWKTSKTFIGWGLEYILQLCRYYMASKNFKIMTASRCINPWNNLCCLYFKQVNLQKSKCSSTEILSGRLKQIRLQMFCNLYLLLNLCPKKYQNAMKLDEWTSPDFLLLCQIFLRVSLN